MAISMKAVPLLPGQDAILAGPAFKEWLNVSS
jgi:hypothetical protein